MVKVILFLILIVAVMGKAQYELDKDLQPYFDDYKKNTTVLVNVFVAYVDFINYLEIKSAGKLLSAASEFIFFHKNVTIIERLELIIHEVLDFGDDISEEIKIGKEILLIYQNLWKKRLSLLHFIRPFYNIEKS